MALLALLAAAMPAAALAAGPDDILGTWYNQEKDARMEIVRCGANYCGKIVWLKDPNYPEGSKEGIPGTPKVDHHNPDGARRKEPVLGLQIVNDMRYDGGNHWTGGTVYDPKNGKTYKGKMTLVSPASDGGTVELGTSHVDEGWMKKWGKAKRTVNFIGAGFLAALLVARRCQYRGSSRALD